MNAYIKLSSCDQNLTCKVMAAVGFPLFTSLINFLSSCLENIFGEYFKYFHHRELTVPLPALSHSSRHILCHVDVAPLDIMEFFRCESYHSFCTFSIPAFLRTSSLSLNSSKQTKTGLGNKKHENWMTRLNVRKLEVYL